MSGHNPHSHLSQPNSSWNPLQIPSYIPRQPQLAHMSNERPLVRSPLTWHSPAPPTPPEAFYNFLSNHKSIELNPLLPTFVRGPPPFGSVDLTIQSARNSTTPSPRNLASSPPQEYPGHNKPQQPQQQQPYPPQHHQQHLQHQQQIPRSLTPNNLNSSSIPPPSGQGVIQSTGSVRDKFQCSSTNSNNNGEIAQAHLPPTATNIYIRDARQINNEIAKIAAARDSSVLEAAMLPINEPVELTKESSYLLTKSHIAVPISPKRLSPSRPPSIPNCTPMSPRSRSPLTTLTNTGSTTDIINNHSTKVPGNGVNVPQPPPPQKYEATTAPTLPSENSPLSLALPPSPTTTASNEDSVDSQTSKSRRKRKPNKTTRVSNDSDESMHERGECETILPKSAIPSHEPTQMNLIPDRSETLIDLDSKKLISSNTTETAVVIDSNNMACQSDNLKQDESRDASSCTVEEVQDSNTAKVGETVEVHEINESENKNAANGESPNIEITNTCEDPQEDSHRPPSPPEESPSVIVNNTSINAVNRNVSNSPTELNHSNTKIINNCQEAESPPTSLNANQEERIEPATIIAEPSSDSASPTETPTQAEDHLDSPQKRSKQKGDSDDIETIDKIAAMIAGTQSDEDDVNVNTIQNTENCEMLSKEVEETKESDFPVNNEKELQLDEIQPTNNNSKISDLTNILETPPEGSSPNKDLSEDSIRADNEKTQEKENVVENCFEEVENKLEEMFAGIEDGEPPPCILPPPTIDEPITPEVISELGLGGITSPLKQPLPITTVSSETVDHVKSNQCIEDASSRSSNHHNSSQKRPHTSSKSDSAPPNKKRKISKKSIPSTSSSSSQKPSTTSSSTSSKSSKSHSSSNTSHGNKQTKSNEKQPYAPVKEKVKEEPVTVEYKGPFIQVKSDGTINVINAPTTEDVVEKQNKVKKSIHNHSNSDRSKIRGLHVSTLSTKYDADTTDTTWMCVFCKHGPHKMGLGDLFGPYIITTTCDGFVYSQKDPKDDDFISRRTKADMVQKQVNGMPVVPASTSSFALATMAALNANSCNSSTSKKKRKTNDSPSLQNSTSSSSPLPLGNFDINEIYVGMTKVSETSYEVWVHENCVVWASGVYIIGVRIVDLDTAVWSSTRYKCSICSKNGAMISCLQRGCEEKAHIPCARTGNWMLDENEFRSMCTKHSTAMLPSS